jgi:hypothetical protein
MLANSPVVKRSLVASIISVLAVALVVAAVITLPPAVTGLLAAVPEYEDSAQPDMDARLREADFAFLDHELRYAGGYGLRPAAAVEKGAEFSFVDHELAYAGGYGLRPAAAVEKGADFDFLDHELRYAGGHAVVPARVSCGRK